MTAVPCAALAFAQAQPAPQAQKPPQERRGATGPAKPESGRPAAAQEKPEVGGRAEGIKVHGHWVLEIRNPDGTLASRKEFENSLASGTGAQALAAFLTGKQTPGVWSVLLTTAGSFFYQLNGGTGGSLNVSTNSSGQIILQGTTAPASAGVSVQSVQTQIWYCLNTASPSSCMGVAGVNTITSTNTSNITVQTGQTITATVTISFQ